MHPKDFLNKTLSVTPLALAINTVLLSTTAYAVESGNSPQARTLETITVTAQKREQSIQNVPISVSAFYNEDMKNMQIDDIGDLQSAVPNLTLHQGDAQNAVVYIRGVGQIDSLAFADPGVGIYLDDVYLGRAQGAFLEVFDVERIEVLRGPQGTLYGRNTMGGAVKYVTAKPEADLKVDFEAGFGSYNEQNIKGAISGAVSENLLANFTMAYAARDDYSDNTFDGKDDGGKKLTAWRSSWFYDASSDLTLEFAVDSSENNPDHSLTPVIKQSGKSVDPRKVTANFNNLNKLITEGASLTATWEVNSDVTLKSISSYRSMDYDTHLDLDATAQDKFGIFVFEEQDQFSQELQLNYSTDSSAMVAGLYYFNENDLTESGVFGPVINFISNSENDQKNTSYAIYANLDYFYSQQLTLTAGLRYTKEEKEFSRLQQMYTSPLTSLPVLGEGDLTLTDLTVEDDWSSVSPKVGINYQLDSNIMLYGTISRGFKSGGFNGRSNNPHEAQAYNPETMWAYETGMKSDLMDDLLRFNVAIFRNDYDDLQLSSFTADDQGAFSALFTNAGRAVINGLELELTAMVSDDLTLRANAGLMDAQYKEYFGPGGKDIASERELVNTPKTTAQVSVQYSYETEDWGYFTFFADASYRSKTYPTVSSSEVLAQAGRTLFNANVSYYTPDEEWNINLGIKNITDKEYVSHGFDLSASGLSQLAYYGAPRTLSLTAQYSF